MNKVKEEGMVDVQIPFSGFYESWHDQRCTEAVEDGFNYNHETGEEQELPDCFWDADIDWSAIHLEYAKQYAEMFMDEFEFTGKFAEMTSPAYYNFSTDRIFITVPKEQMDAIKDKVFADKEARESVAEQFTSRDGFWSHYSNDLTDEDWTEEPLDECQYGAILDAYIEMQHREDPNNLAEWNDREYALVEDFELSGWDSVMNAQAAVDKAIEEAKIKDATKEVQKAIEWIDNEYLGEHNMPSFAWEAVQELKSAVKKLESFNV